MMDAHDWLDNFLREHRKDEKEIQKKLTDIKAPKNPLHRRIDDLPAKRPEPAPQITPAEYIRHIEEELKRFKKNPPKNTLSKKQQEKPAHESYKKEITPEKKEPVPKIPKTVSQQESSVPQHPCPVETEEKEGIKENRSLLEQEFRNALIAHKKKKVRRFFRLSEQQKNDMIIFLLISILLSLFGTGVGSIILRINSIPEGNLSANTITEALLDSLIILLPIIILIGIIVILVWKLKKDSHKIPHDVDNICK